MGKEPAMNHTNLIERLTAEIVISDDSGQTMTIDLGEGPTEVSYGGKTVMLRNPDGPEAAQAISTLTAEVEELRAALEPFADAYREAEPYREFNGQDCRETYLINAVGLPDFKKAHATPTKGEGDKT